MSVYLNEIITVRTLSCELHLRHFYVQFIWWPRWRVSMKAEMIDTSQGPRSPWQQPLMETPPPAVHNPSLSSGLHSLSSFLMHWGKALSLYLLFHSNMDLYCNFNAKVLEWHFICGLFVFTIHNFYIKHMQDLCQIILRLKYIILPCT